MNLMVVFSTAVILGIAFRLFKLPSIVGQVLAGFLVGLTGIIGNSSLDFMRLLSTLGITLLLFLVGLELNWRELKHVGSAVVKIFLCQTIFLIALFYFFSISILGFQPLNSFVLAIALSFSSTIVVIKILSEKRDLGSFSGKLTLGLLLLQDFLAIILLVLIPGLQNGFDLSGLSVLGMKLLILLLVINVAGHLIVGVIMKYLIRSTEDLILFSLLWFFVCLYFSVQILGLSAEIGGLLAGVSLSSGWAHYQIVSKVKTLRDIFLTLFFVLLGLEVGSSAVNWSLVFQITTLAIFGKFGVTQISCFLAGLKRKISFAVSLNMTQLSEFSLIVMSIGFSKGYWGNEIVSAVTVAGLLSMVLSTLLMLGTSSIYRFIAKVFPSVFKATERDSRVAGLKDHVILMGGDRTGRSILASLKKNGEKVLIVDFNPDVVKNLQNRGELAIFSDASDPDVLELTNLSAAKMVISTVKDIDDSMALLSLLKQKGITVPTIVDAESATQASELYKAGASYVIFPHFVSGLHLGLVMKKFGKDTDTLKKYKLRQNETLKEIYEGEF
ncbi:MAG: Transporter, CPA2 family [Candidatus Collierbacteria bacterium GW2011_GWD2_45_10]|nr:MAG: Transporter, CPA2 family [Candidatus Collierbacteria bacterium GW2011_GWA2_44_13]KKT50346.1 MAG: Transporter, CPA2 family [Candidatus Collierbacteria bacterium GW2011_GWB1_44_197]KKT62626.1 MAG: Transporter, CPA2 family [Candidatus Collierbacteria bacterium GW2011_GWD1_44_27]KKT89672.1 MAG: Transporter, CPA2 family [Candidatus Collierbacteria bacterium GW2011_GWD2_45_10]